MPLQPNIPLSEEFNDLEWTNYSTFDAVTKEHLPFQKHLDIRPFTETPTLFKDPVSGKKYPGDILAPENWVLPNAESTTGPEMTSLQGYPTLKIHTINGTVEATSTVESHPLNLKEGFEPTDHLVFSLPSYPLAFITQASSYLELGDTDKKFTKLKFSESITSLSGGGGGHQVAFTVPLSTVEGHEADLTKIITVRFKIAATAVTNLFITGLRIIKAPGENPAINPGWVPSSIDFDNWNGRTRRTVPLPGASPPTLFTEIEPTYQQSSLWKSAPLSGPYDPMPVNAEFGVVFNSGSAGGSSGEGKKENSFTLYLRQQPKIFNTMLDLIGVSMAELDGEPLPDLGTRQFLPRSLGEYDDRPMEELDRFDMEELERRSVPNPLLESWIYFTFSWEGKTPSISIGNNSGIGYNFVGLEGLELERFRNYFIVFTLEEKKAQARLYDLYQDLADGGLGKNEEPTEKYFRVKQTPLFDTTIINDDDVFHRRKGRVGFSASFQDPAAFVRSIRPRGVTFSEYKSAPLLSHTPVAGAQLFVNSADTSLWEGDLSLYPEEASQRHVIESIDKSRTTVLNGFSYKVTNQGVPLLGNYQGLQTEFMNFTDLEQLKIEFDLWFAGPPREETFPSIIARLESTDGTIIPLTMPELETNQWQHISLRLPVDEVVQTGFYQLQILQQTRLATSWWVSDLKVLQRDVEWSARAVADDPWEGTYAPWTSFGDVITDLHNNSGISIEPRGKELQLRAQARRQDVAFQIPKLVPRYAQLGRLAWPEDQFKGTGPTANFTYEIKGSIIKFTDTSTKGTGFITKREWSFGDGTRLLTNSLSVEHEYDIKEPVVAGIFPTAEPTLIDTFERTENPLANGWTIIQGMVATGRCRPAEEETEIEFPFLKLSDGFSRPDENPLDYGGKWSYFESEHTAASRGLIKEQEWWPASSGEAEGAARWNVEEVNNPTTQISLGEEVPTAFELKIWTALDVTAKNGYYLQLEKTGGKCFLKLVRWKEGVKTVLKTQEVAAFVETEFFGIMVLEGTVSVWREEKEVFQVVDTNFKKGFGGISGRAQSGTQPRIDDFYFGSAESVIIPSGFTTNSFEAGENGAYWSAREYEYPGVSVKIGRHPGNTEGRKVRLWACLQKPTEASKTGYYVEQETRGRKIRIAKWSGGVATILKEVERTIQSGDELGISVQENKVIAWTRKSSLEEWSQITSANDSSYKHGFVGISGRSTLLRAEKFKVSIVARPNLYNASLAVTDRNGLSNSKTEAVEPV